MTVQELIEKLMEYPLDAEIVFAARRDLGGGNEYYEAALDVWQAFNDDVYITPDVDTDWIKL